MSKIGWTKYVDGYGNFELPNFLYQTLNNLMKASLDYGTLLGDDDKKLRAYREMVKSTFKDKWIEVAEALKYFDLISPCSCDPSDFCRICGGSRYILNEALSPDQMNEIGLASTDPSIAGKLAEGLRKAHDDLKKAGIEV